MSWDRNVWEKLGRHFVSKSGDVIVGLFDRGQNAVKRNVEMTSHYDVILICVQRDLTPLYSVIPLIVLGEGKSEVESYWADQ